MATALKLSDELVEIAKPHAAAQHRSIPKQIEHWARLGKAVEDNPELPVQFIHNLLKISPCHAFKIISDILR